MCQRSVSQKDAKPVKLANSENLDLPKSEIISKRLDQMVIFVVLTRGIFVNNRRRCHKIIAEEVLNFIDGKHTYEHTNAGTSLAHLYGAGISHSCYMVTLWQRSHLPIIFYRWTSSCQAMYAVAYAHVRSSAK